MISKIILTLWWLTVTCPVERQDTGFSDLFKGPINSLSSEGSSLTVRKNEDETVTLTETVTVSFNSYKLSFLIYEKYIHTDYMSTCKFTYKLLNFFY